MLIEILERYLLFMEVNPLMNFLGGPWTVFYELGEDIRTVNCNHNFEDCKLSDFQQVLQPTEDVCHRML